MSAAAEKIVTLPRQQNEKKREPLKGWQPVLVTTPTYARLREIRQSTMDPPIHMNYLAEAAMLLGLEQGMEAIVKRAGAELKRRLPG